MSDDRTMSAVSHSHPETGESFGAVYRRGPVAADGGADVATDGSTPEDVGEATMQDVDHTNEAGQDIWARGGRDAQHGANK